MEHRPQLDEDPTLRLTATCPPGEVPHSLGEPGARMSLPPRDPPGLNTTPGPIMAGFLLFKTECCLQSRKKKANFTAYVDILVNSVIGSLGKYFLPVGKMLAPKFLQNGEVTSKH